MKKRNKQTPQKIPWYEGSVIELLSAYWFLAILSTAIVLVLYHATK